MIGLFFSLMVVSYLLGFVAFLSLWQLSRLARLPLMVRRALFCALGTIMLAPMIAPAGLSVVYVPNGLILLISLGAGAPLGEVLGDYLELYRFALPSFGATAAVFALIAWRVVKADAGRPKSRWMAVALPAVALLGTFQVYRFGFPDRGIPDELNNAVVEDAYGPLSDEVGNLLRIAGPEERRAEIARLTAALESDPAIVSVLLYEPGATVQGEIFSFRGKKGGIRVSHAQSRRKHTAIGCPDAQGSMGSLTDWICFDTAIPMTPGADHGSSPFTLSTTPPSICCCRGAGRHRDRRQD